MTTHFYRQILGLMISVCLRMKYLLQRCMFLFKRSKKSWNPWQPSRKPILLENQISSSVFAAWSSRGMKQVSSHQLVNLKGCKPISPFCPVVLVEWNHKQITQKDLKTMRHIIIYDWKRQRTCWQKKSTLSNLYPTSHFSKHLLTTALPPKQEETSELKVLPGCFCRFASSTHQSSAQQLHLCSADLIGWDKMRVLEVSTTGDDMLGEEPE